MKKILVLIVVSVGIFFLYQKIVKRSHDLELLYEKPYVAVYGKDTCGWTQKYLQDIEQTGFKYVYKNLAEKVVNDELHPRMRQAGLDTHHYLIPVLDINGRLLIRPSMEEITAIYNSD